jgi:hypothetical protein
LRRIKRTAADTLSLERTTKEARKSRDAKLATLVTTAAMPCNRTPDSRFHPQKNGFNGRVQSVDYVT